jgi:serine/threonine protein kinase
MQSAAACLDDNRAAEFATGALGSGEAAKVEQHLASCRDCRSLVAALAGSSDDDSDLQTSPRGDAGHPGYNPTVPAHGGARGPAFTVGDRIGRYVVLGRLGQGGMGVVLSAYDPQLDRKVAIKLLRTGTGVATAEARARMIREAKAIAQLSHPNVVAVYDVGTADPGDVYIAMEFVEGDTVTAWKRRWDRPWREVLDVFLQAGRGLAAAHGAGLLHRDFKPDNVLVGADGRVRVGDFGLARSALVGPDDFASSPVAVSAALAGSLTATGTIVGTPRFMAPETLRGRVSDARSDQFSFCVALYEALFDRHPIDGDTAVSMIESGVTAKQPPDGHKVPASIVRAVLRGLEDVPTRRYPSMTALIADLTLPPVRAPRRMLAAAGIAVVAMGAAGAAVLSRRDDEMPVAKEQHFRQRIKELEAERDELIQKVIADGSLRQELRKEIQLKDQQIQDLLAAESEPPDLEFPPVVVVKRPVKPPPDVGLEAVDALRGAAGTLTGCFGEWSERYPAQAAELTVRMTVAPNGSRHTVDAVGVDDSALPLCVADAVKRIPIPAPGAVLRLAIDVSYAAGGGITIEPHVVGVDTDVRPIDLGQTGSKSGLIDLDP